MEPIKQEIINNIFENGDKLITGPILQTVLIDMIDDVNVKDQEILSKTGSWDNAATQIPNLATKVEVTNLSESIARDLENVVDVDLTGYATEQWVQSQGYLKEHQDISNLATKTELTTAETNLQGNITSLSESVARDLANVSVPEGVATEAWVQSQDYASKSYVDNAVSSSSVDLTGYATETWVQSQGYLKEHQDISGLATKTELNDTKNNLQGNITSLSESVARDLTGYATETWVQNQGYLTEHQDISGLATKTELNSVSESVQTDITNLSESVASSVVWKKGTGTDSIVQKVTDSTLTEPIASGKGAVAIGQGTNASGQASHAEGEHTKASGFNSHAEGFWTEAPGNDSHAEGGNTVASGQYSHAEGWYASTTNQYEHAQGQYNHNSKNQIFSVGAGEVTPDLHTNRRNAVSILVVPNSETQINTASVFVQNVGGYDGTNPTPGTNDLATVINNLPSGGGSSETLWKKGTGTDSIVQKLTGANEAKTSTATGVGAVAIGSQTTASGDYSHAEGLGAKASGNYSHAEGFVTVASGENSHAEGYGAKATGQASHAEGNITNAIGYYSHAEGRDTKALNDYSHAEGYGTSASGDFSHAEGEFTIASNEYEHAQGRYNYTSSNQIFSIGTGNSNTDRRNAVSVLEVDNSGSYTASFFVQNIGGYDGTNPTPGTNDLATVINNLPSGGGSSETLWKKGTGQDSLVQVIADGTRLPAASEKRAIAVGESTKASGGASHAEGDSTEASGWYSHAEGGNTKALGNSSHAEGIWTKASGPATHAEGGYTEASNEYEHAQGRYNHSSTNQIFSIGTGNSDTDRRNAVSVLEVSNNNSYTSSFFVQNVGGYDGTNPTPGTNDLATVINGLSSGGGSSETLWKKGTGTDSIVQVVTEDRGKPRATGVGAVAIGYGTHAAGNYSHAEGYSGGASESYSHTEGYATNAHGQCSHAEGYYTEASGQASHAEGYNTSASNAYEHAQGINNHSSANQIFSVGAGDSIKDPNTQVVTETRRNAISVLSVPNSETQINTASFFVQNVGGYDGTNPLPGTNDLATVINNLPSGGGTGDYLPLTGGTLTGKLQVNSSMGVGTSPQGTHCLAVGDSNTNTWASHYALAVGENCQVEGAYGGVSLGRENVVDAAFGLATGFRCRTTYMAGYAGGCRSTASANFAFAAGFGAEATRVGQVVLGAYNELDPSGNNDSTGSYAVILANGKSSTWNQDRPGDITRSNGLAIKWDGGIDIKYQGSTVTLQDKLNEIEAKIPSSTETWTFTLEDGTTVTKNILIG